MSIKCFINSNGYLCFKDSGLLVSRWVAAKKLGRKLRDEEVVHHKNRNKLDNHPKNLWVFPNQKEHDKIHRLDAKIHGHAYSYGYDNGEEYDFDDYDDEDYFDDDDDDSDDGDLPF